MAAETRAVERAWVAASAAVVVVALVRLLLPVADPLDFALRVVSSARVGRGEMPYRDVSVLYGPLAYVVQGAVQRVSPLGAIATARGWFFGLALLNAALLAKLFPRPSRTIESAIAFAVAASFAAWFAFYSGFAFLLVLAAVLCARAAFGDDARSWPTVGLGAVGALTVFARPNFGGYVLIAGGLGFLTLALRSWRDTVRRGVVFVAGAAVATGVVTGLMAAFGALRPYVTDLATYLARFGARTMPLRLTSVTCKVDVVLATVAVLWLLAVALREQRRSPFAIFSTTLAFAFLTYSFSRFDAHHVYVALALLAPIAATRATSSSRWPLVLLPVWFVASAFDARAGAAVAALYLALALVARGRAALTGASGALDVVVAAALMIFAAVPASVRFELRDLHSGAVRVQDGLVVDAGETKLVDFVRAGVGDGLFIASYPGSCECTSDGCADVRDYLLTGALPAGRLWFFDTPSSPYPEVQDAMSRTLDARRTRFVVFQKPEKRPCAVAPPVPESHRFFDHVRAGYDERARIASSEGELIVYERRDGNRR